jgi:hypothetical protein
LFIYSSVAVRQQLLQEQLHSLSSRATTSAVASPSLSEPLSESPSTIAAVTNDKFYQLI